MSMEDTRAESLPDYPLECHCGMAESKALARKEGRVRDELYAPVLRGDGVYFLDLDAIMHSEDAPTSKQVLIPFLQKGDFKRTEIKCSHIPPWFYVELPVLRIKALAEKKEFGYLIALTPEIP